jgi:chemotaxis protein MotA
MVPGPVKTPPVRRGLRLDIASLLLAPLGLLVIVYAQALEGVPLGALVQGPAALIVFGGTLGAVLVSHSLFAVIEAVRAAARTFTLRTDDAEALSSTMIGLAIRAHRRGMLAVEAELDNITDPFLREGLTSVVDETPLEMLRDALGVAAEVQHARDEEPARIFESAAGYAPTLGILGAVIGLIRVMQNLAEPGALGSGIAVAFVATVYGVGLANLILLPLAVRLREHAAVEARRREMMVQGICAIHQRLHPRLVTHKLRTFSDKVPRIEDVASRMVSRSAREARLPA